MRGRTNQPLEIAVWSGWVSHPAINELRDRGHRIAIYPASTGMPPDLILHPAAGWHEALFEESGARRPYLEARVRWARAQKRGKR